MLETNDNNEEEEKKINKEEKPTKMDIEMST
jgi:hypothetical protein